MASYAEHIAHLPLLETLRASDGRADITDAEVESLVTMVTGAADAVGSLLDRIPLTFRQYTQHDLRHSANLIRLMGKFIPGATKERLNAVELAILALSAILHDVGMFVTDAEKAATLKSAEYQWFESGQGDRALLLAHARGTGDHLRAAVVQDALLAEYFRRLHSERAALVVDRHLAGKLTFRETDLTPAVLRVCESHGWGVLESNDPRYPEKAVARLSTRRPVSSVPVNEQYLAICLRLADIMDFDRSRTPAAVFQHLAFTEEKSWEEWNKHLQVEGWYVDEHEVMYSAPCTHPAFYVAVMEFLDWIDAELSDCRLLVKEAPKRIAEKYELHLPPVVDRRQVDMRDRSYLAGAFRFQLDYERIMQLLMDKSLYPDPSLFLRELLQNALDACRTREAHAKADGMPYEGRIDVWDHSGCPDDPRIVFQDNGSGMSRRIVENYFMRVGRSYYKSAEFELERQRLAEAGVQLEATSQFGIGILSCFMVADKFEVETFRETDQPLKVTIEGPTKYFIIRLLQTPDRAGLPYRFTTDETEAGPPQLPGTRITVHLHPGIELKVFNVLNRFAVNVDYPIHVHENSVQRRIEAWRYSEAVSPAKLAAGTFGTPLEMSVMGEFMGASVASFEEFEFCRGLRGRLWVWLLRDDSDRLLPRVGKLALKDGILACTGLPRIVSELVKSTNAKKVLSIFKKLRQSGESPLMWGSMLSEEEQSILGRGFQGTAINNLSVVDIDSALEFMKRYMHSNLGTDYRNLWCTHRSIVQDLRHSGNLWSTQYLSYEELVQLTNRRDNFAFYGISLPAGIVEWRLMVGESKRLDCIPGGWGVEADLRGSGLPRPAASRLSISSVDAAPIYTAILRAVLVHAVTIATDASGGGLNVWRAWLDGVIDKIGKHLWGRDAIFLEFERLETVLGYDWKTPTGRYVRTRTELIEKYGRWIPCGAEFHFFSAPKSVVNNKQHPVRTITIPKLPDMYLDTSSEITRALLLFRPRRRRSDGVEEVDLAAAPNADYARR